MDEDALLGSARLRWGAGEQAPAALGEGPGAFTLAIQVDSLGVPGTLVAWEDAPNQPTMRLLVSDAGPLAELVFQLATSANPKPIQVSAPVARIGADSAHAVVVRFLGCRLELLVDGVLLDEEWPLGRVLAARQGAVMPAAAVRRIVVWDRVLSDDEIDALAEGRTDREARADRYLGPRRPLGQYWRPRGLNVNVGDCMPFFHDGRFHLFYLLDRHHHQSMWGCGGHQWAHASTTDLVQWEEHPLTVAIDGDRAGSNCTGSVFFHGRTFYAFYAVRMFDRSPSPLCAATSTDGIHFAKTAPSAHLEPPYLTEAGRDPVVLRDEAAGGFRMLVTTALVKPGGEEVGCLAQLFSRDLQHWEQREPFLIPGYRDQPECPDHFEWNGWYYLLFSSEGVAHYRKSRQPFGPWEQPTVDVFDGPQLCVMKTAAFTGGRRIGAAFVPDSGYGGWVAFRELVQHADGALGTKWPPEMVPATTTPVTLNPTTPGERNGLVGLGEAPRDFLLRARVRPTSRGSAFGVQIGRAHV